MKKVILLICAAIMLLGLTACVTSMESLSSGGEKKEPLGVVEQQDPEGLITCPVQYIRTDGYQEGETYPQIAIVESLPGLEAYVEENHWKYSLGCRGNVSSDTTIGFVTAVENYDEAWFEEHTLVLVLLEEGSGSNRHEVQGINADGEILIKRIIPEVGTCDMAKWHILLELPKDSPALEKELTVKFVYEEGWVPPSIAASYDSRYASVQVSLPGEGWVWEEIPDTGGDEPFGIRFWPEGDKDAAVELCCYPQMLGVCGTGLTIRKLPLDSGGTASLFVYDDAPWFLISFDKTPGWYYAMKNSNAGDAYDDEILEILGSAVLGWGNMDYDKVVTIAESECDIAHDYANAYFDINTGFWRVSLGKNNQAGGGAEVIINDIGGIDSITYGE